HPVHSTHSSITIFFHCSLPPRYLHSFPTRRSSDLARSGSPGCSERWPTTPARAPASRDRWSGRRSTGDRQTVRTRRVPPTGSCADRKSTRLNSSHVSISYAVFCLKKKKKV